MRLSISFILLFISYFSYSQSQGRLKRLSYRLSDWVKGTVVFTSGDSLECDFAYNFLLPEGTVQIREQGKILTFGPKNITRFSYHDSEEKKTRVFASFQVRAEKNQYRGLYFFEVLFNHPHMPILGHKNFKYLGPNFDNQKAHLKNTFIEEGFRHYFIVMKTKRVYKLSKRSLLKATKGNKAATKLLKQTKRLKTTEDYSKVIQEISAFLE